MPSKFKIFLMAIRPKTLSASIAPVLMGTAMAFGDGVEHFPTAGLCLLGALLIQIGTNLANDYFDFKKGADTRDRVGPVRVTQAGLVPPNIMMIAIGFTFILAIVISLMLVERGGTPIAIIGLLSIVSGILYTAGPKPLGYIGLGDIFVLIFFGPVAVAGTYYVQSFEMNAAVLTAGFGPGILSVAILCVNNVRDLNTDRISNKRTLAVRFGRGFALSEYLFCIFMAACVPVFLYLFMEDHSTILLSILILFLAITPIKTICSKEDGPVLNKVLAQTGQILLMYSIIFSIGWIL